VANIREVAKRAGVSIATVSAVLTQKRPVSPELTQRVREACRELDYYPNALARAIFSDGSKMIAFLVPTIANPGFSKSLLGVEAVADERGYVVFVANTRGLEEKADAFLERLFELRVDGVIISLTHELVRPEFLQRLQKRGIHTVGISAARETDLIDCFLGDEESSGRDLGRYLIMLGHVKCAYIAPKGSATGERRLKGLKRAYSEAGLTIDPNLIVDSPSYDADGGAKAAQALLARAESFTAVIVFNDYLAAGVLLQFASQGLHVPRDISVATFGDNYARLTNPPLTAMHYPEEEVGRIAAEALLDRIEGRRSGPPQTKYIPIRLMIRQSTRALPDRDPDPFRTGSSTAKLS
jgi:LacI family repressor for deo operon, udp, cdd, tsx, nupC, and nupG